MDGSKVNTQLLCVIAPLLLCAARQPHIRPLLFSHCVCTTPMGWQEVGVQADGRHHHRIDTAEWHTAKLTADVPPRFQPASREVPQSGSGVRQQPGDCSASAYLPLDHSAHVEWSRLSVCLTLVREAGQDLCASGVCSRL